MAARTQGRVKSFNAGKGFGFIDIGCGTDVFVHIKDCTDGKQPLTGDVLSFVMEPSASKPGQMVAKSVEGGTGAKEMFPGPQEPAPDVPGTGSHVGKVRTWNDTKGYGFIDLPGQPNVWLHVKECVNTQPQSGDWVRFDVQPSDFKQGQMVAKNVTGGSQPLGSRPAFGPIRTGDGTVDAAAYGPYAAGLAGVAYQAAPVQPATAGYVVQQGVAVQQEIPQQYGYVEGQVGSQVYQQPQPDYQQYAVQQPGMQYAMQQPAMQPAMQMQPQAMQPQGYQQGYQQGMQGMQGMQGYGMQGYQQGMQGMQGVQGMQQQGYQQMGMQPQQMQFQQAMQQPMQQLQQPMQQPMQQGFMQQMPQQQMAQPMMQPGPEMQAGMGSMGVGMDPNVQMSLSGVAPPTAMAPMAPMGPMAPVASLELQPAAAPAVAPIPAADAAPAVQVPAAQEAPQEAPQEAAEAPAVAAATPQ